MGLRSMTRQIDHLNWAAVRVTCSLTLSNHASLAASTFLYIRAIRTTRVYHTESDGNRTYTFQVRPQETLFVFLTGSVAAYIAVSGHGTDRSACVELTSAEHSVEISLPQFGFRGTMYYYMCAGPTTLLCPVTEKVRR
jgi:hypothetical protein